MHLHLKGENCWFWLLLPVYTPGTPPSVWGWDISQCKTDRKCDRTGSAWVCRSLRNISGSRQRLCGRRGFSTHFNDDYKWEFGFKEGIPFPSCIPCRFFKTFNLCPMPCLIVPKSLKSSSLTGLLPLFLTAPDSRMVWDLLTRGLTFLSVTELPVVMLAAGLSGSDCFTWLLSFIVPGVFVESFRRILSIVRRLLSFFLKVHNLNIYKVAGGVFLVK